MVTLNFLAAPRAARTGHARDLGEQENWEEAFQKTDTYANLALCIQNFKSHLNMETSRATIVYPAHDLFW